MDELSQDAFAALDELLDAERSALLDGDLEKIARLLDKKESLIDSLNTNGEAGQIELQNLNQKISRNQELLNSALDGIRIVARRLATMRRIRKTLDTYDAQGRKNSIDMQEDRSVEKRA